MPAPRAPAPWYDRPVPPTTAPTPPPRSPDARRWDRRRHAYHAVLLGSAAAFALYVGPNLMLFGKPTWIDPSDFVPIVAQQCVPIVRAMMEYERDHGRRPDTAAELAPDYLSEKEAERASPWVENGGFWRLTQFNHDVVYLFSRPAGDVDLPAEGRRRAAYVEELFADQSEGWYVAGPYTRGRIPVPPVTVGASTRPAPVPD